MKRPLLRVALLYVGGIVAADFISLPLMPILAGALLVTVTALIWRRVRPVLLYPLLFLAGLANSTFHTSVISPIDLRTILGEEPHLATIRGTLLATPAAKVYYQEEKPDWRTLARIEVSSVRLAKEDWQAASGRIAVTTRGQLTNCFSGQLVEICGVAAPPRAAVAEGTFDYRRYLKQQGIYYQVQAESEQDWSFLDSPAPPLVDRFLAWGRRALALGLPTEDESLRLEWALALGWKTALTEEASEPFVQAATYHIFAVDGLRMAIVFGIFYGILRALGAPRPVCGVVLVPVIWFYVALTGWPASAIRAAIMLTIVISGWALKRPSEPLNSLFAAALIILVWEPQQLFQAGFQLSFFVVLCLVLTIRPLFEWVKRLTAPDSMLPVQLRRRWPPFWRVPAQYAGDLLLTSFAAWIGSLPLVAYYFNIVTPVSTPANLLAVPLCVLVLISNLISLLLAAWFPGAAEIFNHAGWFGMECIRLTSHWFANCPGAYFYTSAPSLFTILLYYTVLIALVTGWALRPNRRAWKLAGLGTALLVWGCNYLHQLPHTRLSILPANGGTVIYCDALGAKHDLLIDVGSTNSVQFTTKPFLRAQGVNQLPTLILTHGDLHHIGGAEAVVRLFDVRRIFTSPVRFRSAAYRRIVERLGKAPGLLNTASQDDLIGEWKVLHPNSGDRFPRADDGAIVLRASLRGTRVLLLSDLGRAGQDALLERIPDLRADIVIAGLPAIGEPLCEAMLDSIQPRLIIVSDSEFPASERASATLRARLDRRQVPVIYTRAAGAVTLEFRNHHWDLRTMNGVRLCSDDPNPIGSFTEQLRSAPHRQSLPVDRAPR